MYLILKVHPQRLDSVTFALVLEPAVIDQFQSIPTLKVNFKKTKFLLKIIKHLKFINCLMNVTKKTFLELNFCIYNSTSSNYVFIA